MLHGGGWNSDVDLWFPALELSAQDSLLVSKDIFPTCQSMTSQSEGRGDKVDLCQVQVPLLMFQPQLQLIINSSVNLIVQLNFIHQPRPSTLPLICWRVFQF